MASNLSHQSWGFVAEGPSEQPGSCCGRGGDLAADILEKRKRTLLQQLETRCDLIIEGTLELQRRLSDGPMRAKLRAHYSLSDDYIY